VAISDRVRKLLWAEAAGRCSVCRCALVEAGTECDQPVVVGEEAHIVARSAGGPRGGRLPADMLDEYNNLILLCPKDHKRVDDRWDYYTVGLLHQIKEGHVRWARSLGVDRSNPVDPLACGLARDIDPAMLGVHRAERIEGLPEPPPYVPRDQDAELDGFSTGCPPGA
jgi:hypothetical protein